MVGYGKRLKEVRTKLGLTQKEFAKKLGLEWHKIKNIETEKHKLTPELAEKIEQIYSINGWWLLTGKGSMHLQEPNTNEENNDDIEVNFYPEVFASAGYGYLNNNTKVEKITLSKLFLKTLNVINPKNLDIIAIYGDSMEPDFHHGDFIIVERINSINEAKNGNVVIANIDGEIYIKKILKDPITKKILLISSNSFYKPIQIDNTNLNNIQILGIVRGKYKPI